MSDASPSRRRLGIAAAVLVGGVALWWVLSGSEGAAEEEVVEDVALDEGRRARHFDGRDWRDVEPPPRGPSSAERAGRSLGGGTGAGSGDDPASPTPRHPSGVTVGARDVYRAMTTYPPDSRPLEPYRHHDLIDWNQQQSSSLPVEGDPLGTTYLFTADAYWVLGETPLTCWLQVSQEDEPVEAEVLQAWARLDARRGEELTTAQREPILLEFQRDGDRNLTTFVPAERFADVRRPVNVLVYVEFTYDGARTPVRAALQALWNPPGQEPARFTGEFRDAVEGGSLVVYVGVEVTEPGFYNLDANLWSDAGEPVAWTKWRGDLEAGVHEAPLRFFGKAITDSGTSPPWRIEQLRGFRYAAERYPAVQPMDPWDGSYTCGATLEDGISEEEWQDPMEAERLAELERVEAAGGNPPVPLESFLGNLPPAQRAREAERYGVDPNDFTAEALAEIELPQEAPEGI